MILQEDVDKFVVKAKKHLNICADLTVLQMAHRIAHDRTIELDTEDWIAIAILFSMSAVFQETRANRLDRK